jgi:hypothetical protein
MSTPHSDWYEIHLLGRLDPRWATSFDGMALVSGSEGTTVIRGPVADQASLHGLLARLRDLGLPLLSVAQVEPEEPGLLNTPVPGPPVDP